MNKSQQSARRKLVSVAAAAVLAIGAFSANTAFAGGFIEDLVKNVVPGSDQDGRTHCFETSTTIEEYLLP